MKKKITYIILIISVFIINNSVMAINLFDDSNRKDVCGLSLPSNVPTFTSGIFNVLKIIVPIILIIMGIIDFTKAVMANDEKKMKESTSSFIRRLIAAIFIFFIVAIVQFVFKQITSESGFTGCMKCVLNNTCNTTSEYYTKVIKSTCVSNCENIKDSAGKSACLDSCKTNQSGTTCDKCDYFPTSEKSACLSNCKSSTVTVNKKSDVVPSTIKLINPNELCPTLGKNVCKSNNLCKWEKKAGDSKKKCYAKEKPATSTTTTTSEESSGSSSEQQKVVTYAKNFATTKPNHRYVYGGNTLCTKKPFNAYGCGVDCSSFVQRVYANNGYKCLPRTAQSQADYLNAKTYTKNTKLKVGDLLFYNGSCNNGPICHVTMYTGNNKVVHASSTSTGVIMSPLNYRTPARYASVIGNSKCKKS